MKSKDIFRFVRMFIEEFWHLWVLLWNLPVGVIELIWLAIFDRERFKVNIKALKDMLKW